MEIYQFACRDDNYGYLVHDKDSGTTVSIDAPELGAIEKALSVKGWTLTHILNTHHHYDHVDANLSLKAKYGCQIVGPMADAARIPGIDVEVSQGDIVAIGNARGTVHDMPGHTRGHIVYHFPVQKLAFVGDVIFPMGCGRLFEGTASQGWRALERLSHWAPETLLYCAHEYTEANGSFALSVEPNNENLQARCKRVKAARERGEFTVPSTLAEELETNPFLRPHSREIQSNIAPQHTDKSTVFERLRLLKDQF